MHELSPYVAEKVLFQNEIRSEWSKNDTAEKLDNFIFEEHRELQDAIQKAYIGDGAFEVASEIGDIFYLYTRRSQLPDPISEKVDTTIAYAEYIAELSGIDIGEAVMMKVLRNDMKYGQAISNNGYGYEQSVKLSKEIWKAMGGDAKFSEAYLEIADNL